MLTATATAPVARADWTGYWFRGVQVVVGLVFLVAGIGKAADPRGLEEVLKFDGIQGSMLSLATSVIVMGEIALGQAMILGWGRRWLMLVAGAVILLYTLQLTYLLVSKGAPNCNCLRLIQAYQNARAAHASGLIRNAILFIGIASALYVTQRRRDENSHITRGPQLLA